MPESPDETSFTQVGEALASAEWFDRWILKNPGLYTEKAVGEAYGRIARRDVAREEAAR
ncbi:MAG: hypothetical protein AAF360_07240 [Pseudomonadota bacterium]